MSPVQGDATNIIASFEDTYVSSAVSPPVPCLDFAMRSLDEGSLRGGEHSPALGVGGPHKTTTPNFSNHHERAATAATACESDFASGFELDLRYLLTCMMTHRGRRLTREVYGRGRCEGD